MEAAASAVVESTLGYHPDYAGVLTDGVTIRRTVSGGQFDWGGRLPKCNGSNKEIAAALYLSEGTVKQYINQLYAKLDMGGDPRTRRARLAEWYQKNAPRN